MSCGCGSFHKVGFNDPFDQNINVPKDADLYIGIQATDEENDNEVPFNWDEGTLVLKIYENEGDENPLLSYTDADWTKSQSQYAIDEGVAYNDIAEVTVKNQANDLQELTPLREYLFTITFTITAEDRAVPIWQAYVQRER